MKLRLLILVVLTAASGCLWTPKPYANDPLILHHRAKLGDPEQVRPVVVVSEPLPPPLPADPIP